MERVAKGKKIYMCIVQLCQDKAKKKQKKQQQHSNPIHDGMEMVKQ